MLAVAPERSEARRSRAPRGARARWRVKDACAPHRGESGATEASRFGALQWSRGRSISQTVESSRSVRGYGTPAQDTTQVKDGALPLHPETLPWRSGESPFTPSFFSAPCAGVSRHFHVLSAAFEFISRLFDMKRDDEFEIRYYVTVTADVSLMGGRFVNRQRFSSARCSIDRLRRKGL